MGKRKVLVVGNYGPDEQESMLRFTRMIVEGLRAQGEEVETIAPEPWFGGLRPGTSGLGKWLAYLDKYVLFPRRLRKRVRGLATGGIVHIADHSNAMYARAGRSAGHPVVVTCHDLGAVRGALGEDTDCPASRLGKILQAWIARSLGEVDAVPCVSTATQRDVQRLIRRLDGRKINAPLIFNGLNVPYGQIDAELARERLVSKQSGQRLGATPFILNVGSALSRKNRDGALRIFAKIKHHWPEGRLVFVGEALTEPEKALADDLQVSEWVDNVVKPSNETLEALYNRAVCLLFPSKFEGFGWPAIEAQACGCPVLCSDAGSLGEIAGSGAFVRDYRAEDEFAAEALRLAHDESARQRWIQLGQVNIERFRTEGMIEKYRQVYDEVSAVSASHSAEVAA